MDTTLLIGIVVALMVAFFAFQWWSVVNRKAGAKKSVAAVVAAAAAEPAAVAAPIMVDPPKEEKLPVIAGQTAAETLAKEPAQRPIPAANQQPADYEGNAPAQFQNNLRRPEQAFHQPQPAPALQNGPDVPSGRAAAVSTPLEGHQQPFSPEFAQNGGAMIGNSVFAYDGTVPTDFSAF